MFCVFKFAPQISHYFGDFYISLNSFKAVSQGRYKTSSSKVTFYSKAPLEDIEGKNSESQGIIDAGAKTFFFKIPVKSFDLKSDLMEEHFNENYMESEKYPYATYKGTIETPVNFKKDGEYTLTSKGELNIHGVVQKREIVALISIKKNVTTITSSFKVKLADHKIEIPSLVFQKIAEEVEVSLEAILNEMK